MSDVNNLRASNDAGFINIYNGSGFIAMYTVQYYLNGVHHFYQTPQFSLFFSQKVNIPNGAINIQLRVQYYLDIRTWVPFFDADFDTTPSICYKLYGTIYNPGCGQIPCDGFGEIPPDGNNPIIPLTEISATIISTASQTTEFMTPQNYNPCYGDYEEYKTLKHDSNCDCDNR